MINNCEAKGLGCVLTLPINRGREQHGNEGEAGDKGTGSGKVRYGRREVLTPLSPPTIDPPDKSKVFTKLVLEGQINSALRFLSESTNGGVLSLTDEVMTQLQLKHPNPQPAKSGSLLLGPFDDEFPESVYSGINGEMVRQAALRTKDSGVPVALTRTASDEC